MHGPMPRCVSFRIRPPGGSACGDLPAGYRASTIPPTYHSWWLPSSTAGGVSVWPCTPSAYRYGRYRADNVLVAFVNSDTGHLPNLITLVISTERSYPNLITLLPFAYFPIHGPAGFSGSGNLSAGPKASKKLSMAGRLPKSGAQVSV